MPVERPRFLNEIARSGRFCARPQRLGKRRRADRHHHEFLNVDVRVGVRAAIENIHHRYRQQPVAAAFGQMQVQRLSARRPRTHARQPSRRRAARWRRAGFWWACRRARSSPGRARVDRVDAGDGFGDLAVHVRDGFQHALAEVALLVAVSELSASRSPVDAPEGRPRVRTRHSRGVTSTSTVGFPRESRISLPCTLAIFRNYLPSSSASMRSASSLMGSTSGSSSSVTTTTPRSVTCVAFVFVGVESNDRPAWNQHVAIDDRAADTRMPPDANARHEDAVLDDRRSCAPGHWGTARCL